MSKFRAITRTVGLGAAGALAVLSVSMLAAQAPTAAPTARQQAPSANATKQDEAATSGQNMMAMRQKMMVAQKESDARLQPLIDKMNAATGSAKVDVMAAVVTELVRQHAVDGQSMNQMSQMMMPNMMGMMMQGVTADMRKLAAQCPMMKGFGETPSKP